MLLQADKNRRPRRIGRLLALRIGLAAGALSAVCGTAVIAIDAFGRVERLGVEIRRSSAAMLAFVEADAASALARNDRERALDIAAALASLRYVRRVELLAAEPDRAPGLPSRVAVRLAASEAPRAPLGTSYVSRHIARRFFDENGMLTRLVRLDGDDARVVGALRVFHDTRAMAVDLESTTARQAALAALAAMLMGLGTGIAVWRGASRPIRLTAYRAARLREETFDAARETPYFLSGLDPRDEIGSLAQQLDRLLARSVQARLDADRSAIRDSASGACSRAVGFDHLRRSIGAAHRNRLNVAVLAVAIDDAAAQRRDGARRSRFDASLDAMFARDAAICPLEDPAILRATADRLRDAVREGDIVARLDDSSFLVVADQLVAGHEAADLAARLHEAMRAPAKPGNSDRGAFPDGVAPTLSIGVALAPADGEDPIKLAEQARQAAREAAMAGGDKTRFTSRAYDERARRRRSMERALAADIRERKIDVYAQPKVRAGDGIVDSVELLARWAWRADDGRTIDVEPAQFIALAEDCGLIGDLGDIVMSQAASLAARLAGRGIKVAFNVSARETGGVRPPLAERVLRAVRDAGAPADSLEVEITESVFADSLEAFAVEVGRLRDAGVRVFVDDFGTGAANFAYLTVGGFAGLKIDQRFVASLPGESRVAASIANLAAVFGLECVAEGVETAEQASWLSAHGVTRLQGFYFHKPVPVDEFAKALEAGALDRPLRPPLARPLAAMDREQALALAREAAGALTPSEPAHTREGR